MNIDDLSAGQWALYAADCDLYPGDVVAAQPSVPGMEPGRLWVVRADQDSPPPIGGTFPVRLVGRTPTGGQEGLKVASRTMLRLIRRGGGPA